MIIIDDESTINALLIRGLCPPTTNRSLLERLGFAPAFVGERGPKAKLWERRIGKIRQRAILEAPVPKSTKPSKVSRLREMHASHDRFLSELIARRNAIA